MTSTIPTRLSPLSPNFWKHRLQYLIPRIRLIIPTTIEFSAALAARFAAHVRLSTLCGASSPPSCRKPNRDGYKSLMALILLLWMLPPTFASANPTEQGTPAIELKSVQQFIHHLVIHDHFNHQQLNTLFSQVILYPPSPHKHGVKAVVPLEKMAWYHYRQRYITPNRVKDGIQFWHAHQNALALAEKRYHVPASIIIAIIGVESNYGQNEGQYPVFQTLTILSFSHSRRAHYFRRELEQFLLLCREEHFDPQKIKGSYDGAIGQPQFMPSSYRYYAVDFSHNHHRDLVDNESDVIGSIANYFHKNGWRKNQPIAVQAALNPHAHSHALPKTHFKPTYQVKQLEAYGLQPFTHLPAQTKVRLITLEEPKKTEYWLGLHNFYVITRYNYSTKYAMVVYQLSREIVKHYHQ